MTKTQFLVRFKADVLPKYLKKYPKYKRLMEERIANIESDRMTAHCWGNLAQIVISFGVLYGVHVQPLMAFMEGERTNCMKAKKFS